MSYQQQFYADFAYYALLYNCTKCLSKSELLVLLDKALRNGDMSLASAVFGLVVGNMASFPYFIGLLPVHCNSGRGAVFDEAVIIERLRQLDSRLNVTRLVPSGDCYTMYVEYDCGDGVVGDSCFQIVRAEFETTSPQSQLFDKLKTQYYIVFPCHPLVRLAAKDAYTMLKRGMPISLSDQKEGRFKELTDRILGEMREAEEYAEKAIEQLRGELEGGEQL